MDPPRPACCELAKGESEAEEAEAEESGGNSQRNGLRKEEHFWLDPQLTEKLPVNIRKGECGLGAGWRRREG